MVAGFQLLPERIGPDEFMEIRPLSVIVPAFNEALLIERTIAELLEMTPRFVSKIIVIDDGSTDSTRNVLRDFAKKTSSIEVLEHRFNQGFGAAIAAGLSRVDSGYVAWLPADGAIDPSALHLVDSIEESVPVLFGFRNKRWVGRRRFVSGGVAIGVRVLFGVDLTNFSGFFVGDAGYLRRLNLVPQSTFFTWQVAIRSQMATGHLHKTEVPLRPSRNSERTSRAFRLPSLVKGMTELLTLWVHIKIFRRMKPND